MLTFRLALDEQTSRSEANAHGRHDVTRCAHKAVSTRQAGCEKPIVEQIGGVERKAPTVPVNLGKRIYGRARRRDDRIERDGGNCRIDTIRERQRVVKGKIVSVRAVLGGSRIMKKKK